MKLRENTFIRTLTPLALCSRINLAFWLLLCLANLLFLLSSTAVFPKVKSLEALVDSNMVG